MIRRVVTADGVTSRQLRVGMDETAPDRKIFARDGSFVYRLDAFTVEDDGALTLDLTFIERVKR